MRTHADYVPTLRSGPVDPETDPAAALRRRAAVMTEAALASLADADTDEEIAEAEALLGEAGMLYDMLQGAEVRLVGEDELA